MNAPQFLFNGYRFLCVREFGFDFDIFLRQDLARGKETIHVSTQRARVRRETQVVLAERPDRPQQGHAELLGGTEVRVCVDSVYRNPRDIAQRRVNVPQATKAQRVRYLRLRPPANWP